ncbi:MAG: hypothetical protein IMF17_07080, partial [Proteobacteria bacterium]|nr:hypothetical protein [Pseudomonadota bacterium]
LALYPRLKEMVDKRQRIRWKRLYVLPSLVNSNSILYLADNAGETVFDRVLIETLELPVEPQGRIQ